MALTPGMRLGAYEVLALLGSGGMGEVYRARDTRLDRIVAIKVLPASVAADPDRRQRWDREARAISALNHPHICTLHDVGHQNGIDYLVMELLEGQTLAERLTKGALPLDQAVQTAIQLADALDVAHRHGIVHRDLKPANVFLARQGASGTTIAKLLDFGIAKAASGPEGATSATVTDEGTLLGTVHYMAPEQLEGHSADARSDLFAFGAVLYEMVSGRRAFPGESRASVIAAVLDSEPPPLSATQALTPPALEYFVKTCLAKNPDQRWQTAGDVRRQLDWIAASGPAPATTAGQRSDRGARLTRTVAVMVGFVALIAGGWLTWYARAGLLEQAEAPRVTRTTIATSGPAALALRPGRSLAITPDGTRVVYIGNDGTQLFVRPIDRFDSTAIFTAAGPLNDVFISPDGKSAGFIEGNTLKTIALTGGPAETIVRGGAGYGGAWAADDTIIFPASSESALGLQRVSTGGGDPSVLTRTVAARGERTHVWPSMLPGGRAVLFTIFATTGGLDAAQVAVLDLVTGTYKVLVSGGSDAHYVPGERGSTKSAAREGGHVVYVKAATLMAIPFDPARLEATGRPVMVLPRLATRPSGSGVFHVADDGTLVYADPPAGNTAPHTLVWVDRRGAEKPLSASLPPRPYGQPRLSPDGAHVAVAIDDQEHDIWVWDVTRQALRQLTSGPQTDFFMAWTRDSRRLIFIRGVEGLFWQAGDGTGKVEALKTTAGAAMLPSGVTPDGTRVLFSLGARDVMAMTLDDRRVEPLIQTPFDDRNGVVSSDGRWLAYESDSTQKFEIYVTPYPNTKGGTWPVSTAGGTRPLWSANGRELFFVAPDGAIMAASVDASGGVWRSGAPVKVVDGKYATGAPASGRNYDVSADGQRFLMVKAPTDQPAAPQIQLVQHWADELNRLVPATR